MTTIQLECEPSSDDLKLLLSKAHEDCYCTQQMHDELKIDTNPTTCLPCACRFALNAITSVVHEVKMGFN